MRYLTATTYAISQATTAPSPATTQELIELSACADACESELESLTDTIQEMLKTFGTWKYVSVAEKVRGLSITLADEANNLTNCEGTLRSILKVLGVMDKFHEKLVSLPTKK